MHPNTSLRFPREIEGIPKQKPKPQRIFIGSWFWWDFRREWQPLVEMAKAVGAKFDKDLKKWRILAPDQQFELARRLLAAGEPAQNINMYDFESEELLPVAVWKQRLTTRPTTVQQRIKVAQAKVICEGSRVRAQMALKPSGRPVKRDDLLLWGLVTIGCEAKLVGDDYHLSVNRNEAMDFIVNNMKNPPEVSGIPSLMPAAMVTSLYSDDEIFPHQKSGINFLYSRRCALLADDMGCIDGDALVTVNRGGCSRVMTLRHLHEKFHGATWDKDIPTKIRCLFNGELRSMPISATYNRGVKKVLLVKCANGKKVKATPDHEFMTDNGWVRADELKAGQVIWTNGRKIGTDGYTYINGVYRHPKCPKRPNQYIAEHRLIYEAYLNGLFLDEYLELIKNGDLSKVKYIPEGMQVHHVDGNKQNNHIDNLELVSVAEHAIEHNKKAHIKTFIPKKTAVESIAEAGECEVFDVTVPGADSFVANGIVVHNCGKTLQAVMAAEQVKAEGIADSLVVVCPVTLMANWRRELKKWESSYEDVRIIPYSQIHKVEPKDIPDKCVMIFDESHYLKNATARRTTCAINLADACKEKIVRLWMLTGTPVTKDNADLWSAAMMLGHPLRKMSPLRLAGMKGDDNAVLSGAFKTHMLMRKKEDCLNLPPKIRQTIDVDTRMARHVDVELLRKGNVDAIMEHLMKLKRMSAEAKIEAAIEFIEPLIQSGSKVVLFSDHTSPLHKIHEHFGYQSVLLDGTTKQSMRDEHVQRFQTDPQCMLFCGNIKAAGVGITLTASTIVVFVDLTWLPADVAQAEDRCHRIGQNGTVNVYYLTDPELITDMIILRILGNRSGEIASFEGAKATALSEVQAWVDAHD